jgi:hypothetical protein
VISHASGGGNSDAAEEADKEWRNARSALTFRSPGEIEELFAGFEMVGSPGLVTTEWETETPPPTDQGIVLCGVGKLGTSFPA